MFKYSRKMQRALLAVRAIAAMPIDKPVRTETLSNIMDIPKRYLQQSLQQLVKYGILISHRGPKGGFTLKRTPKETSVGDIIDAIHQLDFKNPVPPCDIEGSDKIETVFFEAQLRLQSDLHSITLADLSVVKTVAAA